MNIARSYIRYLLEEVKVVPKKDYTISILGDSIHLIVGEEKKIPRYIAFILREYGIVEIVDGDEKRAVLSKLIHLLQEVKNIQLSRIDSTYYANLLEAIADLQDNQKKFFLEELNKFMKLRVQKVLHRLYTKNLEGLDFLEVLLIKIIDNIVNEFIKRVSDDGPEIINRIRKELSSIEISKNIADAQSKDDLGT